jgi:hypothetical protein
MVQEWVKWHQEYDVPGSKLSRRLTIVRGLLEEALVELPEGERGERRLISFCAGDGRDTLPVLAAHAADVEVKALLVELDPELSAKARNVADSLGLPGVQVRTADAGLADGYLDAAPADVVMACGLFGNISSADMRQTVASLPALVSEGAIVIWTVGHHNEEIDPSDEIRAAFKEGNFEEEAFVSESCIRVGMHRFAGEVADARNLVGSRLFTFTGSANPTK